MIIPISPTERPFESTGFDKLTRVYFFIFLLIVNDNGCAVDILKNYVNFLSFRQRFRRHHQVVKRFYRLESVAQYVCEVWREKKVDVRRVGDETNVFLFKPSAQIFGIIRIARLFESFAHEGKYRLIFKAFFRFLENGGVRQNQIAQTRHTFCVRHIVAATVAEVVGG